MAAGFRARLVRWAVLVCAGAGIHGCTAVEPAGSPEPIAKTAAATEGCFEIGAREFCTANFGTRHDSICSVDGFAETAGDGFHVRSNGEGLSDTNAMEDCCGPGSELCADPDGATFVNTTINDTEDIEIRVRLMSMTDRQYAQAGIMLRTTVAEQDAASAHTAALYVRGRTAPLCGGSDLNSVNVLKRWDLVPGVTGVEDTAYGIRDEFPLWLRIQKRGKDFAASRSRDGKVWITQGGGPFVSDDARVGFFVAGAGEDVDAIFEDIYVGPLLPDAGPESEQPVTSTSYIGSSAIRWSADFVSFGMHGFYVAPDGTSYKYSQATDPLNSLDIIRPDGTLKQVMDDKIWGFYQGAITGELTEPGTCNDTGNGTQYLYIATRSSSSVCAPGSQVRKTDADAAPLVDLAPSPHDHAIHDSNVAFDTDEYGKLGIVNGLAARAGTLYVSELEIPDSALCPSNWSFPGRIRRASTSVINRAGDDGVEDAPIDFTPYGKPGPLAIDDGSRLWVVVSPTPHPRYANAGGSSIESSHYPTFNLDPEQDPGFVVCLNTSDGSPCVFGSPAEELRVTGAEVGYGSQDRFNPVGISLVQHNPSTPADDELLIADNGPKQNIFRCSGLGGALTCVPFGVNGGVFAGSTPGLFSDASSGGDRRFFSPLGAGEDACGNVFVASSAPRVDIRRFNASTQELDWAVYGLAPEVGAFDPATDGSDYYTVSLHHAFHPTQAMPWSPVSVTADPFDDTAENVRDRHDDGLSPGGTTKLYARRLSSNPSASMSAKNLFTYQLNTRAGEPMYQLQFYRFTTEGSGAAVPSELATHFGSLASVTAKDNGEDPNLRACLRLWMDENGDGKDNSSVALSPYDSPGCEKCLDANQSSCEREVIVFENAAWGNPPAPPDAAPPPADNWSLFVDRDGAIWVTWGGKVWEVPPTGWTQSGLHPIYSINGIDWSAAGTDSYQASTAVNSTSIFDANTDSLYHYTSATSIRPDTECQTSPRPCWCTKYHETVDRITDFHGSKLRTGPYPLALPSPEPTTADDFQGRFYYDAECNVCGEWSYRSWDVAGDILFMQERVGPVHAFDVNTGEKVAVLFAGAEASGAQNWADTWMPGYMHAFKRENGEYLVTALDSSEQARTLVYRWTPPPAGPWTPEALAPRAWYVASDDDLDVESNGTVSRWIDRTSNQLDLVNTVTGARPSYLATGWNGTQPTVRFPGGKLLRKEDWSGSPAGVSQAFTLLVVVEPDASQAGTSAIAAFWNGWDGIRLNVVPSSGQNLLQAFRMDGSGFNQTFSSSLALGADPHVVAWRYAPGSGSSDDTFTLDLDESRVVQTVSPIGGVWVNTFFLGYMTAFNGPFAGNLSEVVLVDRAISNDEVDAFREYAKDTWDGLP